MEREYRARKLTRRLNGCGHTPDYRCACLDREDDDTERYDHEPDVVEQMTRRRREYGPLRPSHG